MRKDVDFKYEYSDLNMYQIRVQMLTGPYAGLIFELGGSGVGQDGVKSTFVFEYTLYQKPAQFENIVLKGNAEFEQYISEVIMKVIETRHNDPEDTKKLAASFRISNKCKIEISNQFYTKELVEIASRMKGGGVCL
jgi:hypothetical protein